MTDAFEPTPFRFTWRTERPEREPPPPGYSYVDQQWRDTAAVQHGECFRGARVTYGLTLRDVAAGWRISEVEVGELERGLRRFRTPADLSAALSQLWLWGMEKSKGAIGR